MNAPVNSTTDWAARASSIRLETRPLINGEFIEPGEAKRYVKLNPATEEVLTEASEGSVSDVDRAVDGARRAFDDGRWARLAPQSRGNVLMRFAQLLSEHAEELALLDSLDVGKPISQALAEIEMVSSPVRFAAAACDKLIDAVLPSRIGLLAMNVREPIGVVGAIVPWNFPAVVAALKVAPALACGNSVVLKPSELSPLSALRIGVLALEAGVPPGVLNVTPGLGSIAGRALAEHRGIDMITFTGSTATGRALLHASGNSNLKKLLLECGGKSPQIVFADVGDLERVADDVVEQITWNQGQVCVAGSRLLVQESIHSALVARIITRMGAIIPGDPLDPETRFGPLVSAEQLRKVLDHITSATTSAAQLRAGGRRSNRRGFYVEPTLFDNVPISLPIAREEVFGPVLAVMPFSTVDHAIAIAHSVDYGLSARIWTGDVARGYEIARRLRVGEVTVNAGPTAGVDVGAAASSEPFAQSGFGIEGGMEGMRQYTRCKSIRINLPMTDSA